MTNRILWQSKTNTKSVNHQYLAQDLKVVKKYRKTVLHIVSGKRLDFNTGEPVDFLLHSSEDDHTIYTRNARSGLIQTPDMMRFNELNDVIYLYSDDEVLWFEAVNEDLLKRGILVEYQEPTGNSDDEIFEGKIIALDTPDSDEPLPQVQPLPAYVNETNSEGTITPDGKYVPNHNYKPTYPRHRLDNR